MTNQAIIHAMAQFERDHFDAIWTAVH